MAEDRVIGRGNQLPWHLPEDLKWFQQLTVGHIVVMGRRTFESIGKPLPKRETVVWTRSGRTWPEVRTISELKELGELADEREIFICGGAELYRCALPFCSDLYLTLVKRTVPDGDTFFPRFEDRFEKVAVIRETPELEIQHYRNRYLESY